ncbi:MAG: OB-fold nucleic acid binding domain-containing protein [Nanoarchaeota archaeon]
MEQEQTQTNQMKRATAYKLKIGDILAGKQAMDGERFNFLELGNRQIIRVNIIANVVEKYESEGERKYLSLTIDDASGQIRIKAFGEDAENFKEISQGDSVMVIGRLRSFNNELYVLPEIIKKQEPSYLLVRKLELEREKPKQIPKEQVRAVKDQIIEMIKTAESEGGVDTDKLIMNIDVSPDIINQEITKLLEEGLVYEPRPGKIRYLG